MPNDVRLQIVGVIRFSVLTDDFTPLNYGDADIMRAKFFEPTRLSERLKMFEALCLSTLGHQTDTDFRCAMLTSEEMPKPVLQKLSALIAPYPQFVLHAAPIGHHYALIKDAYDAAANPGFTHRCSFRLDDDDGLALDYIARLRNLSLKLLEISRDPFFIAFNRGIYLDRTKPSENALTDAVERAPLSAGTALAHPEDLFTNPYRYNHRAFQQHHNTYSEIDDAMFLRTIHADNISNPDLRGIIGKKKQEKIKAIIRKRFGLSVETLRTL